MGLIGVLKIGIFSEIGIFNISDNPHNRDHSWVIQTGRFFGNLEGGLPGFGNGARGEGNADRSAGIACFLCGGGDFCGGSCLAALLPCCLAALLPAILNAYTIPATAAALFGLFRWMTRPRSPPRV